MPTGCTTYGATLVSVRVPDLDGRQAELTLGYDGVEDYLAGHPYLGSTVGRVGNRIGGARYTYKGRTVLLSANQGPNMLHGGPGGLHARLWDAEPFERGGQAGVVFHVVSEDGDQGFPGRLELTVTVSLTERDELLFEYRAEVDRPSPVNPTNHAYWNLAGAPDLLPADDPRLSVPVEAGGAIGDHILTIHGTEFVELGAGQIPTGMLRPVAGTPFDFTTARPIGERIAEAGGYDLFYVLGAPSATLRPAALVRHPASGRAMEILTTSPGVQFYSSEGLGGRKARGGRSHRRRLAERSIGRASERGGGRFRFAAPAQTNGALAGSFHRAARRTKHRPARGSARGGACDRTGKFQSDGRPVRPLQRVSAARNASGGRRGDESGESVARLRVAGGCDQTRADRTELRNGERRRRKKFRAGIVRNFAGITAAGVVELPARCGARFHAGRLSIALAGWRGR